MKHGLKGITLGENSDKALTDTSKFVFGLKQAKNKLAGVCECFVMKHGVFFCSFPSANQNETWCFFVFSTVFCSCLFLMCCSIVFALLNSAIIFMLFTLQSCVKLIHIKNETWCFFCSFPSANQNETWCFFVFFNQQTQSLFTNTMFFSFYVPSHMHLQIRCASSNDFSVLMVLIQCLF